MKTPKRNTGLRADPNEGLEKDYVADPQVHKPEMRPGATAPDQPEPAPDAKVATSPKVEEPSEDLLSQPMKYVVSSEDAIDRVDLLLKLIKESRPDLESKVDLIMNQLAELDSSGGQVAPPSGTPGTQGAAPAPETTFSAGDKVTVEADGQTYTGTLVDQNEDGTWEVDTDQNMLLSNVQSSSLQAADENTAGAGMSLPASQRARVMLLAWTAPKVSQAVLTALVEGKTVTEALADKTPAEVQDLVDTWKSRVAEVGDQLESPEFIHNAIREAEEMIKKPVTAKKLRARKIKADAMERQVFEGPGVEIETKDGVTTWIQGVTAEDPNLKDMVEGEIEKVTPVQGWWGRFSMPGYLDATEWVFDVDQKACEEELDRVYGLEDEDPDLEASKKLKAGTKCEDCKKKPATTVVDGAHLCGPCGDKEKALLKEMNIGSGKVKAALEVGQLYVDHSDYDDTDTEFTILELGAGAELGKKHPEAYESAKREMSYDQHSSFAKTPCALVDAPGGPMIVSQAFLESDCKLEASKKLRAGIKRLPSGRWKDTNGNSYDSCEEAAEAEAHGMAEGEDPKADPESDEYKARHAAHVEELLGTKKLRLPAGALKASLARLKAKKIKAGAEAEAPEYRINTVSENEFEVIQNSDDELIGTYETYEEAVDAAGGEDNVEALDVQVIRLDPKTGKETGREPVMRNVRGRQLEASAFDEIKELELGNGWILRRKGAGKSEPKKDEAKPKDDKAPKTEKPEAKPFDLNEVKKNDTPAMAAARTLFANRGAKGQAKVLIALLTASIKTGAKVLGEALKFPELSTKTLIQAGLKMKAEAYNGWTNYSTWLVDLWLTNEEGSYNQLMELVAGPGEPHEKMDQIKALVEEMTAGVADSGLVADLVGAALAEVNWKEIVDSHVEEAPAAEAPPVEASLKAADEPDDDKAPKKPEAKKEEAPKAKDDKKPEDKKEAKGAEIEVVDAEGKVVDTLPDAFGNDSVTIIKLFQKLYPESAGKKSEKKDEPKDKSEPKKAEKKEPDLADKPKALPAAATKPLTDEDKELEAAQKNLENRIHQVRGMVSVLVQKNHVVADQKDIDDALMIQAKGKESLDAAMDAALSLAADRKFKELLAMPDANLLTLKASLPNLQPRATQIRVTASSEGLDIVDSLQVRAQKIAAGQGYSIGDAFGFNGRFR